MSQELLRQDSPLNDEEWNRLQDVVVKVARRRLVARRFLDIYGPLGPGVQTVKYETYMNATPGALDFHGDAPSGAIAVEASTYVPIPMIYKDFEINWRDLEALVALGTSFARRIVAIGGVDLKVSSLCQMSVSGLALLPSLSSTISSGALSALGENGLTVSSPKRRPSAMCPSTDSA